MPAQSDHGPVGQRLMSLMADAKAAWPDGKLTPSEFMVELARRVEGDAMAELAQVRGADLYICCAAVAGDPVALARLDQKILAEIQVAVRRLRFAASVADDVQQNLRERLLVGKETAGPKIAQYGGRGSFAGWVRVAAVREAHRLMRQDRRGGIPLDTQRLATATTGDDDPELAYLKRHYRSHFKEAFGEALGQLAPRERNLLRYRYLDELNIDAIGAIHGTHRATAARWLARIRETLLARTRSALMVKLHVGDAELDSVMRLIHSQLPGSISARLRTLDDPETDS